MKLKSYFPFVLLILAISGLSGCEINTRVVVNSYNPPTFSFSGSGVLTSFYVEEKEKESSKTIWHIYPTKPRSDTMGNVPPITYGIIPKDFYQKEPKSGSPPPLSEGKVYEAGATAISASSGYITFTIKDGKIVQLSTGTF
jgi:hypothetical protein